jgi:hypothetical protein
MPQNISSFQMNPSPIKSVNVNLTDWGNYSNNPIEVQYDPYSQTLNINVHRALQDVCMNQTQINSVIHNFSIMQSDVFALKQNMNEWKDLIDAYHKNEAVRKTIDQAKLVAGIVKDDTKGV